MSPTIQERERTARNVSFVWSVLKTAPKAHFNVFRIAGLHTEYLKRLFRQRRGARFMMPEHVEQNGCTDNPPVRYKALLLPDFYGYN